MIVTVAGMGRSVIHPGQRPVVWRTSTCIHPFSTAHHTVLSLTSLLASVVTGGG